MTRPGTDDKADEEGFLTRWSRLKREPEPTAEPDKPGDPAVATPLSADQQAQRLEELIARLPDVETLLPGQDLSAFMRAGVPVELRNQALRRMWSIDPAIRDFVGEALDYAYDYNTPGAAPGYAPMMPSADQVKAVLDSFDQALSRAARPSGDAAIAQGNVSHAAPADTPPAGAHAALQRLAARHGPDAPPAGDVASDIPPDIPREYQETGRNDAKAAAPQAAAAQDNAVEARDIDRRRRRHGGALPE